MYNPRHSSNRLQLMRIDLIHLLVDIVLHVITDETAEN